MNFSLYFSNIEMRLVYHGNNFKMASEIKIIKIFLSVISAEVLVTTPFYTLEHGGIYLHG